jgi:sigma-B regulation protein RsbU (phosphoserine phosphatase)
MQYMSTRLLYLVLAIVAFAAISGQAVYTIDVIADLQGEYPFAPIAVGSPWPTITGVEPYARKAGVKVGDRVAAIDGRPVEGLVDVAARVRAHRAGESLAVRVVRDGVTMDFSAPLPPNLYRPLLYYAVFAWLLMPTVAIGLGVWVAAVRVRDRRAWIMLGILLGLAQIAKARFLTPLGWGYGLGLGGYILEEISVPLWAICMLLFGVYFPQRWSVDRRFPWLKYVLAAVPVFVLVEEALQALVAPVNFSVAASLPYLHFSDRAAFLLLAPPISIFFTAISQKYHDPAMLPDDRRRLGLFYWGATAGLTPMFLLFVLDLLVKHRQPGAADGFLLTLVLLALIVFPLTMAYVVVVERALDVRVVIRQGMQYALASRGVRFLQAVLTAAVVALAANVGGSSVSTPRRIAYIAVSVVLVLRLRQIADRVRKWVDRKFFREAYNTEQILRELSEQVGGILDRGALLKTVARKISESLHVERIAVMLRDGASFRPALATGYGEPLEACIPADAPTLERLFASREPIGPIPGSPLPLEAQLLLPLASRKELLGFIGLGPKRSEEPYSRSDTNLLQTVAAQTGLALENARLSEAVAHEMAQREVLSREIEIAREVQQRLFPQILPEVAALEYAGHCRPAQGVGGDYYDFLALTSGRLGIAIGDVSGKGVPAALLMASLQASVRGQSQAEGGHVAELMTNVNRLVCDASPENRYATFFYGQFDPATRRLIYSNGGHNAPIVLRGTEVLRLECGGPPVGLFRPSRYEQEEIELRPGDVLILFTDGISEAENPAQGEWGEDALIESTRRRIELPPVKIIAHIMEDADAFASGAPQHDDMTLVIARVG